MDKAYVNKTVLRDLPENVTLIGRATRKNCASLSLAGGIECNFRDEKQIIGVGHAQVRDPQSAETIPPMLAQRRTSSRHIDA